MNNEYISNSHKMSQILIMFYKNLKKIKIFRDDRNIYDEEVILNLKKIWKFCKFYPDINKNMSKKNALIYHRF